MISEVRSLEKLDQNANKKLGQLDEQKGINS